MDKEMKRYRLLYRFIVGLTVFAILFSLFICGGYIYRYVKCRMDFKPKKYDTYYGQEVPLHEANLEFYYKYFITAVSVYDELREFELTNDIHYYVSKNDRKPVYTIKKGTVVLVSDYVGEGYVCWPDYDREWRYGRPFNILNETQKDLESDDITKQYYYVKDAELRKAAEAYYRQNQARYKRLLWLNGWIVTPEYAARN